jgi:HTH-type transcriptional regulator/antitoxin HipB
MLVRSVEEIGMLIREARVRRNMTQINLAAKAGVTSRWLRDVEKGKPGAEIGLVFRILGYLGIEIDANDPTRRTDRKTVSETSAYDGDFPSIDDIVSGGPKR